MARQFCRLLPTRASPSCSSVKKQEDVIAKPDPSALAGTGHHSSSLSQRTSGLGKHDDLVVTLDIIRRGHFTNSEGVPGGNLPSAIVWTLVQEARNQGATGSLNASTV